MRTSTLAATLAALVAAGLAGTVTPGSATAAPATDADLPWCSAVAPATYPCIASASHDGAPITPFAGEWSVSGRVFTFAGSPSRNVSVNFLRNGSFELGADTLDDTVAVTLRMGDLVPRVATGKGRDVVVTRTVTGAGDHELEVTGTPVVVSGQCDQSVWPWVCPEYAGSPGVDDPEEWVGLFGLDVTDYAEWDDVAQREAMYGLDYFTNVAATSVPPELVFDDAGVGSLLIQMANRHYRSDLSTVVQGHGELRIPNAFLKQVYGIPNPATMTSGSLTSGLSGEPSGSLTVAQEPSGTAMRVVYDAVTFSARVLRVKRGVVVPTKPAGVLAQRVRARLGSVRFDAATPRGAKVRDYRVRCVARRGDHVVLGEDLATAGGERFRMKVSGLRVGVAYDCRARALSKAGPGPWSKAVRMPARP